MAKLGIGALLAASVLVSGCSSIPAHRGYFADTVLMQSVQAGIDNRQSVERTLGQPSFVSQFGEPVWYYVSSNTLESPFTRPRIAQHSVLAVSFDPAGNVTSVDATGLEKVAVINPEGASTPTLGRERGFLEDLFGNIGQVNTMGGSGGGGGPGS